MGIDTPSDEFYTIDTNQSGRPWLQDTNFSPDFSGKTKIQLHSQRYKPKNGLVISTCQDIFINF